LKFERSKVAEYKRINLQLQSEVDRLQLECERAKQEASLSREQAQLLEAETIRLRDLLAKGPAP
jgi:hypothetical protein